MSQNIYRMRPQSALPNVIFAFLILNGLAFALQQFAYGPMVVLLGLWPLDGGQFPFRPWQLLTYGFLHGNVMHIAFNMFGLWMFGRELEQQMGSRRFLTYLLVCIVGAGIVQLVVTAMSDLRYVTIGASGGVFGILLAFGMTFPNRIVIPLFPPIPMKAKYFVILFGLLELYFGATGSQVGVANFAHLGGMLFGFGLLMYWKNQRR
jgi:membrane associated rhomboid family serine protease